MMPQIVRVRIRGTSRFGLWIPLLPVAIILSPLLVLGSLVLIVACLVTRINPLKAMYRSWRVFTALRGFHVEVRNRQQLVLVDIF
jgi:hypothetical protein